MLYTVLLLETWLLVCVCFLLLFVWKFSVLLLFYHNRRIFLSSQINKSKSIYNAVV